MRIVRKLAITALTLAAVLPLCAQSADVEVDYNRPKKYVVGGVRVEGNTYFKEQMIVSQAGVRPVSTITVPVEEVSNMVKSLMLQKFFDDVSV